jgi:DNA-binding CsgD family transcriptional regulator
VEGRVGTAVARVIGRERELAALRGFFGTGASGRALVLAGGAGFGKTALWEAGIEVARARGRRVLVARASGAEAQLSFGALIDLCDGVESRALAELPAPQRSALEVALLRAEPVGVPPEPHAIALGFLNAARALAAREPLLIAIDDVPWLDAPSVGALAFAARRLHEERAAFLLTRRPGRPGELERALAGGALERLEVGPLSLGATRRLLLERLGLIVPRALLRRIVESTMGSPLFALEFGRALREGGLPGSGEDIRLPDTVEDALGVRMARLAAPVRRLLLAVALSADLRRDELAAIAGSGTVEDALEAGLLRLEGQRVRASHPLFAAAARKRSGRRERRELHLALAETVAGERRRALHLARAVDRPDARLAVTVAGAAGEASARGARQEAVVLAEHALRLTSPVSPERGERLLALAGYLETAGEAQRLTDLLAPEVAVLPAGAVRARAWLLLSEGAGPKDVDDLNRHLDRALAECRDDPGLRAYALAKKSGNATATAVAGLGEAEAWALEALAAASGAGADVERLALYALGWVRALSGRAIDEVCARFRLASDASSYIAASPERIAGQRLVWRGEVTEARATLTGLLSRADERGEPASYALARLHVCELELRVGEWDAAARLLDEWVESAERELLIRPMYERCRALLAAGRGLPGEARRWAAEAIGRAETVGCRWDWLEALRARGSVELLEQEPARAAESLLPVWEHTIREGVDEPGVFPVAPELVEALAAVGRLDEARAVTDRLSELAEDQEHPWGRASAKRCRAGLRLVSARYDGQAGVALAEAAADYRRLGLPFEAARCLLGLGRAQRRLKQWGAARESLERAAAQFVELGSAGWAERARSELGRVGGRRPVTNGGLTPSERDVVELAARGLANKEIAQALSLAVHTVEVHLSRAYAKLGVRSRAELAGRLSGRGVARLNP